MMKKTLGGERLGSGKKMKVELHGYERSTHDMGYVWRSSMSAGTLVPFLNEIALPGDTFDIKLQCKILTHPSVGPLFGTYKVQLDIFMAALRLYQGQLHNNKLGIGRKMEDIWLPMMNLWTGPEPTAGYTDLDNAQINPSCIMAYLGIRGIGRNKTAGAIFRAFNAVPLLVYWDIYKNYYANKQEEVGAVVHTAEQTIIGTVTNVLVDTSSIPHSPTTGLVLFHATDALGIDFSGAQPLPKQIIVTTLEHGNVSMEELGTNWVLQAPGQLRSEYNFAKYGNMMATTWDYINPNATGVVPPTVHTFPLSNIDDMREDILVHTPFTQYYVNDLNKEPYSLVCQGTYNPNYNPLHYTQQGLALKTYQSDLFNNWLSAEWIDGVSGINEITAISTIGDKFTLDALYLANKVYQMLNRVAVSGGSYDDWLDVVYMHERYTRPEIPTYQGGLIKELVFQEVISNSESTTGSGTQPLGTIAGRGILADKHKGGNITIKVDEPSLILGLISITPRIDYSQGNKWHMYSVLTMNDLHKPALDQIGFQDSTCEMMAWWSTKWNGTNYVQTMYGKQTGWIHYQTNVNQVLGNFAIETNEMFMTLNRRYEVDATTGDIKDLTTYIDPSKFNHIFAQTTIDSQNFWAQIGVDMIVRRKMSAKTMPNL